MNTLRGWTLVGIFAAGVLLGFCGSTRPTPVPAALVEATLRPGDNLWTLGSRFGATGDAGHMAWTRQVRDANGWRTAPLLRTGDTILVPDWRR